MSPFKGLLLPCLALSYLLLPSAQAVPTTSNQTVHPTSNKADASVKPLDPDSARNLIDRDHGFDVFPGMESYRCNSNRGDPELEHLCPHDPVSGSISSSSSSRQSITLWDKTFAVLGTNQFPSQLTGEMQWAVRGELCRSRGSKNPPLDYKFELAYAATGSFRQCTVKWGFEGPDAAHRSPGFKKLGGEMWLGSFRPEEEMGWERPKWPEWRYFGGMGGVVPADGSGVWSGESGCLRDVRMKLKVRAECPYFGVFPSGVLAFKNPVLLRPAREGE